MSDVYDALNKLCDTMKTSSYDEPCDEDNVSGETTATDEYYSYEAPVSEEVHEATYEESVALSYEASFAKCKVAPAASHEAPVVETYEASFAKCSLAPVKEIYEETIITDYEEPNKTNNEDSFARCSLPPVIENLETPAIEECEASVAEIYEAQPVAKIPEAMYKSPVAEIHEAPVVKHEANTANVTPETNYTSNLPPPVPKRTLLPKTTKETVVAQETSVVEEVDVQNVAYRDIELVCPEDVAQKAETGTERWSDTTSVSLPGQVEDIETVSSDPGKSQCEPASEMYYTASSEVSLLSDTELADKAQTEDDESKDDRKNVISGHVAAMRERFESMTRTNTPCPDLARSLSPSLEVFRNLSPSPDRLA